jgi:phytoene dehydrogenase-like protein
MVLLKTGEVVVVGSGITGLCLGALLAKAGYPVRVLEAHPAAIGGHARTLTIGGLEFCAGPRYVYGFGKGQVGRRLLAA